VKRRLLWVGILSAAIALVIVAAVWLGGASLSRRLDQLSAKAESLGLNLTIPSRASNPEAELLRTEIDAFSNVQLESIQSGMTLYSESAEEISAIRKDIAPVVSKVLALSNCSSYGKIAWSDINMVVIQCAEYLLVEGNAAIIDGDIERLVSTSAALRRILHITPSDEVIGAAAVVLAAQLYADLLQRGAFAANNLAEIDSIIGEATKWKIQNFRKAAANLAAEEFLSIEQEANAPIHADNPYEYVNELSWRTEPGRRKLKILALSQAIAIYPKWSDDVRVWKALAAGDFNVFNVIGSARFLKLSELQLRRIFSSLWATLQSRKAFLREGTWPTVAELEAMGVEVRDPLTRKLYEWKEIDRKKRLYGRFHTYGDTMDEDFLLVSDGERERDKAPLPPKL
jgi:hypothetical protein